MEISKKGTKSAAIDELPEDIVAEILLRFPIEPLFALNCVSKQWKSFISGSKFGQTYLQRAHSWPKSPFSSSQLYELLFEFNSYYNVPRPVKTIIEYLPTYQIERPKPPFEACMIPRLTMSKDNYHPILASSGGLVLSSTCFITPSDWYLLSKLKFHVSNPLTKQSVQLPLPKGPFSKCVVGLATRPGQTECRNAAFVKYKIVLIQLRDGDSDIDGCKNCAIEIFCSDTGRWSAVSGLTSCPNVVLTDFYRAEEFCYRGILHWLDRNTRTIVTYDPFDSPNRFGRIQLPNKESLRAGVNMIPLGYGFKDSLRYGEVDFFGKDDKRIKFLHVWRLVDYDKGEWCIDKNLEILPRKKLQSRNGVCRQLFVPNLWWGRCHHYCCLFEVFSDISEVMVVKVRLSLKKPLVPVELCPWSSPFYGQAG